MKLLPFYLIALLLSLGAISCVDVPGTSREQMYERWTGLKTNGRQYPSVSEAQNIPLGDLVNIRPAELYGPEKENFELLFSQHPDVSKLKLDRMTEEEFIDAWTDLWIVSADKAEPRCKKLHSTIMTHLADMDVSSKIMTFIRCRVNDRRNTIKTMKAKERRRLSKNPVEVKRRELELRTQVQYNRERRKGLRGIHKGAALFEKMLDAKGIDKTLPATELERATRHLRDALSSVQVTSTNLRCYLQCRNKKEQGIKECMINRRVFNHNISRKLINARQREKYKAKKGSQRRDGQVAGPSGPSSSSAELLRQANWWQL